MILFGFVITALALVGLFHTCAYLWSVLDALLTSRRAPESVDPPRVGLVPTVDEALHAESAWKESQRRREATDAS